MNFLDNYGTGYNMEYNFIFDVDGTLTPSRQRIDKLFEIYFRGWISKYNVWLITGSDYEKTVEQLGKEICEEVRAVHNCAGNSIWERGKEIYKSEWVIPKEAKSFLTYMLQNSKFPFRSGKHIEERPGLVNFSIIGRNCTLGERKMYVQYDNDNNERKIIAEKFNTEFRDLGIVAQVAGETGLDIIPVGADKRQILKYVSTPIIFFGDKTEPGGNDYPLAKALEHRNDSKTISVKNWKETKKELEKLYE